jgi:predicted metal-binding protein
MNEHITIFDKQYSDYKQAEGIGVSFAFVTGACNNCESLTECSNNEAFVFPENAPCMIRKREILKEQRGK